MLAALWMRRAAELGLSSAQGGLGVWYLRGELSPLPVNNKEARRLLRLAAVQGDVEAFGNLGVVFANGDGVPRDLNEACRLYRKANTLGNELAKDELRVLAHVGHAPSLAAVRELGLGPL